MESRETRTGFDADLLDAVLRSSPDIILTVDADGVVGYANDVVRTLLGHDVSEWIGRPAFDLVHPDDRSFAARRVAELLDGNGGAPQLPTIRVQAADGEWVPFEAASTERVRHGVVDGMVVVLRDQRPRLSAERRLADAEGKLRHAESHDPLTRLPNRSALLDHLDALDDPRATGHHVVLVVRLCNLDEVRDRQGRGEADSIVQHVAWAIRSAVRPTDFVAAERPSEVVVVLEPGSDRREAERLDASIREATRRSLAVAFADVEVQLRVGMSTDEMVAPEQALDEAGVAARWMCEQAGVGPVMFSAEMRTRIETERRLSNELAVARRTGELELHLQPIVATTDRRIEGFEALLRWRHPSRGLIPAGAFIGAVEGTAAILDVGAFVNEMAAKQLAILQTAAPESSAFLSINVSLRQLLAGGFAAHLTRSLERRGADPSRLVVELTETFAVDHDDTTLREIAALRRLGVRVALDDFGTGFSSLRHLQAVGADILKIDRSFVAQLGADDGADAIVRASVDLADAFGMSCVAEGVETEGQWRALAQLGCGNIQGYLVSHPVLCFDAVRMLVDRGAGDPVDDQSPQRSA